MFALISFYLNIMTDSIITFNNSKVAGVAEPGLALRDPARHCGKNQSLSIKIAFLPSFLQYSNTSNEKTHGKTYIRKRRRRRRSLNHEGEPRRRWRRRIRFGVLRFRFPSGLSASFSANSPKSRGSSTENPRPKGSPFDDPPCLLARKLMLYRRRGLRP